MAVTPLPVQLSLELPNGIGDGVIKDVDDLTDLAPHVDHARPDRADAQRALVRRLVPAAGVKGGPHQDYLPSREPDDPGFELTQVRILEEQLFCHSGSVPRSRSLKITTSR